MHIFQPNKNSEGLQALLQQQIGEFFILIRRFLNAKLLATY